MKLQYTAPSVRVGTRQNRQKAFGWQSSVANSFGYRLVRGAQKSVQFCLHPVVARKLAKVALSVIPAVLACNLICSSLISSAEQKTVLIVEKRVELETVNITLLAKRAMTWGPDNMEKLAEAKLDIAPAQKGQIGFFDRRYGQFRY